MGTFFDDAWEYAENVDVDVEHLRGHGFDPEVCEGCPHRVEDTRGKPCDLCYCPTSPGLLMDRLQGPPSTCIRLEQHAQRSE